MNDSLGVRSAQRVRNMDGDIEQSIDIHGLAANALLQAFPLQLFHDDERMAVMSFDFMNGADAGVVEHTGGASLALEPFHGLVIAGEILGKKFYCNVAPEPSVFSLVHHSHAAATKFAKNSIVRDRLADHARSARTLAGRFAVHGEAQPL